MEILTQLDHYLPLFKKILPLDYDRMLRTIAQLRRRGWTGSRPRWRRFT
ncbi:MAG: hypothetical protein ACLSAF_17125 [Intestinimonas sp.]